jgi:hypothetical protein
LKLTYLDWLIMLIYFMFVLGIGIALERYMKTSTDFFLSGRSIPAWITGLAFISANLGAQEVIGMGASGAKYGIMTMVPTPNGFGGDRFAGGDRAQHHLLVGVRQTSVCRAQRQLGYWRELSTQKSTN